MITERIIHQCWVGPNPMPQDWMQTWKNKHPSWEFILWDNNRVRDYPFVNKDKIDDLIERGLYHGAADIIRYEALYNYGGFAAEADAVCVNPIDELMDIKEDCFTSWVQEKKGKSIMTNLLSLFLGASKGCRLMNEAILGLRMRTKKIKEPWLSTGNLFFTQLVNNLSYPIKIYPSYYFSPTHYNGKRYEGTDKIYSEHYWGTTNKLYKT